MVGVGRKDVPMEVERGILSVATMEVGFLHDQDALP